MDDPTPQEIEAVIAKLRDDTWRDFTPRETFVAKFIVGWDDDITDVEEDMDDA